MPSPSAEAVSGPGPPDRLVFSDGCSWFLPSREAHFSTAIRACQSWRASFASISVADPRKQWS